jgi:hypothetical protein
MPRWYTVAVTETFVQTVNIEAESEQDALQRVEDMAVEKALPNLWDCERDLAVVS